MFQEKVKEDSEFFMILVWPQTVWCVLPFFKDWFFFNLRRDLQTWNTFFNVGYKQLRTPEVLFNPTIRRVCLAPNFLNTLRVRMLALRLDSPVEPPTTPHNLFFPSPLKVPFSQGLHPLLCKVQYWSTRGSSFTSKKEVVDGNKHTNIIPYTSAKFVNPRGKCLNWPGRSPFSSWFRYLSSLFLYSDVEDHRLQQITDDVKIGRLKDI